MIPTTDKEALDELKRVCDGNEIVIKSIAEIAADHCYPKDYREGLAALSEYIKHTDAVIADVMKGIAAMAIAKAPNTTTSIIDALTK